MFNICGDSTKQHVQYEAISHLCSVKRLQVTHMCSTAHRTVAGYHGCKCVATLQVFDEELPNLEQVIRELAAAGVDALIVQVGPHVSGANCHGNAVLLPTCHQRYKVDNTAVLCLDHGVPHLFREVAPGHGRSPADVMSHLACAWQGLK